MISGHGKHLSPKRSRSQMIFPKQDEFLNHQNNFEESWCFQRRIGKIFIPIFHPLGHGEILLNETSWVGGRSTPFFFGGGWASYLEFFVPGFRGDSSHSAEDERDTREASLCAKCHTSFTHLHSFQHDTWYDMLRYCCWKKSCSS